MVRKGAEVKMASRESQEKFLERMLPPENNAGGPTNGYV